MRLVDADALKDALIDCTPYAIDPVYRNTNSNIDMFTVMDILDEQPTVDNWISVDERLPEKGEKVLLFLKNGSQTEITTGKIHASNDPMFDGEFCIGFDETDPCFLKKDYVKYWQPLSQPPKEKTNET